MTAKPIAGKTVLANYHRHTNKNGISDAQLIIAGKAVAVENETADDGLQQVVGETHAAEDAEVTEHAPDAFEGIPRRDHGRDDHQQDKEIVDRLEP